MKSSFMSMVVLLVTVSSFAGMSESDLRFHKYEELKLAWEGKLTNKKSYALQEEARAWTDAVLFERARP